MNRILHVIISSICIALLFWVTALPLSSQVNPGFFEIQVAETDATDFFSGQPVGDFEVQIRAVNAVVPMTTDQLQDLTFAVIWDPVDGDLIEITCVADFDGTCFTDSNEDPSNGGTGYDQLALGDAGVNPNNGMNFQTFALGNVQNFPANWVVNQWETIIVLDIIGGSGSIPAGQSEPQAQQVPSSVDIAPFNWYPEAGIGLGPNINVNNTDYTMTVQQQLPLDLLEFEAEKQGERNAVLNWTTVNEVNTSHFLIERSEDYRSWEGIGTVQAAGESAAELRYEYLDKNVFDGRRPMARYYYRLKMTDLDGKYEYSNIEVVQFQGEPFETQVYAYPNPANQGLHVAFNIPDEVSTPTNMTLYNRLGQMVYDRELPEGTELEFINLKRHNIETGAYILQVIDADNTIIDQQKIIVQRN